MTKIEWTDESLNPFWGCTHGCTYCQARRIAHMRAERIGRLRGYPADVIAKMKRFEPVWLPDADRILATIHKWKKPKTIFMGFMGDIAYQEYKNILNILKIASEHPEHRFLFLTKNAKIYRDPLIHWKISKNIWMGYSDDSRKNNRGWLCFYGIDQTFFSYEPLLGEIKTFNPYLTKWIIIGALTDHRGQSVPPEKGGTRLEWVMPIIEIADNHNIPVFLKNNLLKLYPPLPLRQEFPWK